MSQKPSPLTPLLSATRKTTLIFCVLRDRRGHGQRSAQGQGESNRRSRDLGRRQRRDRKRPPVFSALFARGNMKKTAIPCLLLFLAINRGCIYFSFFCLFNLTEVKTKTGIAIRSSTPMIRVTVSGIFIPAKLQPVQIMTIQVITNKLAVHQNFRFFIVFSSFPSFFP